MSMTPWYNPFGRSQDILATAARSQELLAEDVATPLANRDAFATMTVNNLFGIVDGMVMDRRNAMGIAAVAKIRNTACGLVGRMPLRAYTGSDLQAAQPIIIEQPEAGRPAVTTWSWVVDALLFYGRAWFIVTERYKTDNRPYRLKFVPEWNAEVDSNGRLVKAFDEAVKQADVIRVDGPHEGILNYAGSTLREARLIDRAARRASDNPVPSVELHQISGDDLTDDEVDTLIERWAAARRGENGGVSFTNASVEAKTMGQSAEQLLIDGRNVAALNVARAAGFPAWVVDASVNGSSITYSNSPSRTRELIDYALAPYMAAIEGRFSLDDILPRGQWCRFDYADLLRSDFAGRMAAYKIAKEMELYSVEELRRMELGLPLEGN